jgi:eukaryotic-like serine/threonine-protein kinase
MDFEVGHLLGGKYRIVRRIGVGGMGSVYEARHAGLGTPVAIKVLLRQLANVPTVADRFRREAQVSATLKSPHVTQVTDVDQLPDGRPYLVMELLVGRSLQEWLEQNKTLSREEAVDIGLQILLGLECAHALGVVHRDLKPGNVFLDEQGVGRVAKLLDFGIAKVRASPEFQSLTRPGMVMGTPEYMAPEQAFSADQADARSDIYSVGVMLYEMLSGALPADGSSPLEVAHQVMTHRVRPLEELCPGLPQGLVNLVHQAMHPDRNTRFESALEMRRALSAFIGQLSYAGQVAASAALGERRGQVSVTPQGTEKVLVVQLPVPAGTAEMSRFNKVTLPEPRPNSLPVPRSLQPSPPERSAAPEQPAPPAPAAAAPAQPVPAQPALPAKASSRTAEMRHLSRPRAVAPTLIEAAPFPAAPSSAPRPRRSRLLWLTLCGALLLGIAAATLWLMELRADPGPPPQPPRWQPGAPLPGSARPAPKP